MSGYKELKVLFNGKDQKRIILPRPNIADVKGVISTRYGVRSDISLVAIVPVGDRQEEYTISSSDDLQDVWEEFTELNVTDKIDSTGEIGKLDKIPTSACRLDLGDEKSSPSVGRGHDLSKLFVWTNISQMRRGKTILRVSFSKYTPASTGVGYFGSFQAIDASLILCRLSLPSCLQVDEEDKKVHPLSFEKEDTITLTYEYRLVNHAQEKQAHVALVQILQKLGSHEVLCLKLSVKLPEGIRSARNIPTSEIPRIPFMRSISDVTNDTNRRKAQCKIMDSLEDSVFAEGVERYEIAWQYSCKNTENAIEIFAQQLTPETKGTKGKGTCTIAGTPSEPIVCKLTLSDESSKSWSIMNGCQMDLKLPMSTTSKTSVTFQLDRKDTKSEASDIVATCNLLRHDQHDKQLLIHQPTTRAGKTKVPSLKFVTTDRVASMRRTLERQLRKEGPSKLYDKRFEITNFCMAVIGPDGGMMEFDDNSVRLTIPKGALSEATVIHCHRNMDSRSTLNQEPEKGKTITQYTPRVNCGPDGTLFKEPVELRIRHSITKEDRNDELKTKNIKVFTKEDKDTKWNTDEAESALTIRDEWVYINTNHFTDFFVGTDSEDEPSARADALLSTIVTDNNEPNALCLYILFTGNNENQMKKYRSDMCKVIWSERNWVRFGNFMDVLSAVRTTLTAQKGLILNIEGEEYTINNGNERTINKKYVWNLEEIGFTDQIDLGKKTEGESERVCTLKISQNGHPNSPEPVYVKTNVMSDHQTDPLHCEEKGGEDEMSYEDLERHFGKR